MLFRSTLVCIWLACSILRQGGGEVVRRGRLAGGLAQYEGRADAWPARKRNSCNLLGGALAAAFVGHQLGALACRAAGLIHHRIAGAANLNVGLLGQQLACIQIA